MGYSAVGIGVRQSYTSTVTGFSATTKTAINYTLEGKRCICSIDILGTSNATGLTFTLPFISDPAIQTSLYQQTIRAIDNGAAPTAPGFIRSKGSSSNICDAFLGLDGTAWTASGTKGFQCTLIYYIV